VTNVIDPYGSDQYSVVKETAGIGNETLVIPNSIAENGRWKIIAESSNYVLNGDIWNWTGTEWQKETEFKVGDTLKINATINSTSIANFQNYYPNGTMWRSTTSSDNPDVNNVVEFPSISLGANNASAGTYLAQINWTNKDNNISQFGLFELNFNVTHHTELKPEEEQTNEINNVFSGDVILIKVNYSNVDTGEGISGAYVNYTIATQGMEGDMNYQGGGVYIAEIDTTGWGSGTHAVAISANKLYYESRYNASIINIEVVSRTTLTTNSSNGLDLYYGSNGTIGIQYNVSGGSGINVATIDCNWNGEYFIKENSSKDGHYILEINSTYVEIKTHSLTINATNDGYLYKEVNIPIRVRQIYTNITYEQPPEVGYYNNITFDIQYGDIDNIEWIEGADISLSNSSQSEYWGQNQFYVKENTESKNYTIEFNSTIFGGGGTFQIYVTANKTNYLNSTTRVNIFIGDIATKPLEIYINNVNITNSLAFTTNVNESLTVKVEYNNTRGSSLGSDAEVTLSGSNFDSKILDYDGITGNFTTTNDPINTTTDLNEGVNFLTIYANRSGYVPQTKTFSIQVVQKRTNLSIYLEEQLQGDNPSAEQTYNEFVNITVIYRDNETRNFIPDATVELSGRTFETITISQHQSLEQYSYELNTSKLEVGPNVLTVYAYKDNYEALTQPFSIEVLNRPTSLTLFLGGEDKTSEPTIDLYYGQSLDVSINYTDSSLSKFIKGASVELSGEGVSETLSEETDSIYSKNINTDSLGVGVKFLTLLAQKENHTSRTISITVEVHNRPTDVEVLLNGNNPLDNSIELPIRDELNITVTYFDNLSNSHITGALMQLVGEGFRLNFTENQNLTQYSITINTYQLDVGIRFLTVYMEKENYETHTPLIEAQVNRINSEIKLLSHNTTINTEPGRTIRLNISLRDLDNGVLIKNATLKYTVEFEQGEVKDLNNDGYYEITLSNVPEGTFNLVLTAYAGDDYEFKRYEITLNVVRPAEDNTLYLVLSIVGIGAAIGTGGYLIAYQKVLKYPKSIRKVHKYQKILKGKEKEVKVPSREEQISEMYNEKLEKRNELMEGKTSKGTSSETIADKIKDKLNVSQDESKGISKEEVKKKSTNSKIDNE
jgi:hypothetical protein